MNEVFKSCNKKFRFADQFVSMFSAYKKVLYLVTLGELSIDFIEINELAIWFV